MAKGGCAITICFIITDLQPLSSCVKHNGEWHGIITGSHPQLYVYICHTSIATRKQSTLKKNKICFGCHCKWMAINMRYWICYMCQRGNKWWPARHPLSEIVLLILHGSVTIVSCGTLILHWHWHPCSIDIIHNNTNEAQPITTLQPITCSWMDEPTAAMIHTFQEHQC